MEGSKKVRFQLQWKKINRIPVYLMTIYFIIILVIYLQQDFTNILSKPSIYIVVFIWLFVTMIALLEIDRVRYYYKKYTRWIGGFMLLLAPITSFLTVEIMVSNFNFEMFQSYSLYNLIWYAIIYYLVFALVRSSKVTVILCNGAIYVASLLNYFVFLFRGNPVIPSDLLAWQTGMSVASNYTVTFTQAFLVSTLMMYIILVLGLKLEKIERKPSIINRLVIMGSYVAFAAFVFNLFFATDLIQSKIRVIDFFAPKYTYSNYGTAFGFVANVKAMSTQEPEGYTSDQVDQVLGSIKQADVPTSQKEEKPNIIVIMNEAFSDLRLITDLNTNMDFLPNIRALEKNTIKGSLFVSVFGGATSNTEYEFLTGNSMAVMPQNSVPYQQFITRPTDSLARILKDQGYYNIAMHPYIRSDYKRDIVYPLLGFDEFLSMEDFKNPTLIRSFISDQDSYNKIIEQYKQKGKDKPLFIFDVTMQNHGGYSGAKIFDDDNTVSVTDYPELSSTGQYLSLVRESDRAFKALVDYFESQDEHTIILLFGDHQPVAYSELYNLLESQGKLDDKEEMLKRYQVPFIMWANYDMKAEKVDQISANYLSSYLLKTAGLKTTPYNQYLNQLRQDIPVLNGLYYIDKENNMRTYSESTQYSDAIKNYRYIGYHDAFEKKGKLKKYFSIQ